MWCRRIGYVTVKYLQGAIYIFTYHDEMLTKQNSCPDSTKLHNQPQEQTVGWKQEDCWDLSQSLYAATLRGYSFQMVTIGTEISQTQPVLKHLEASVMQYYSVINSAKQWIYTSTRSISLHAWVCAIVTNKPSNSECLWVYYSTHKPDKLVLLFSIIGKHINWL